MNSPTMWNDWPALNLVLANYPTQSHTMVLVSINGPYASSLLAKIPFSPSLGSIVIFVKYTGNVKCNEIWHKQTVFWLIMTLKSTLKLGNGASEFSINYEIFCNDHFKFDLTHLLVT